MTLCKSFVFNLLDAHDLWHAIMERSRCHELCRDFIAFGTVQRNRGQCVLCPLRWTTLMLAPTRAGEPQVLSSAVTCDPLRAFLFRRPIEAIDTNSRRCVVSDERFVIELLDNILWDFPLQKYVRL